MTPRLARPSGLTVAPLALGALCVAALLGPATTAVAAPPDGHPKLRKVAAPWLGLLPKPPVPSPAQRGKPHSYQRADAATRPGLARALQRVAAGELGGLWLDVLQTPPPGALGGLDAEGLPAPAEARRKATLAFYAGQRMFTHGLTPEVGLGPWFNSTSCGGCHRAPNIGGGGRDLDDGIFTHAPPKTQFNAMTARKFAIPGRDKEPRHGVVHRRRTPPLYGLGRLDRVPNERVAAGADVDDRDGNGISGRMNERGAADSGALPARFGSKANEWDLLTFSAGAMTDEMMVTNALTRQQPDDGDGVANPEAPEALVRLIDAFVRQLAPPPRGPINEQVRRGEALFGSLGCVGCHAPALGDTRGAYTDLLVHDMGAALDDTFKDGNAGPREWRTAPLWGVRFRARLLHDERASTIPEALAAHQGEAQAVADRFRALSPAEQAAVVAFVESL